MMKFLYFILFLSSFLQAHSIDPIKLNDEISELNDIYKYENSIIRLESIINDKKSTNHDRYHAYLQKALTYKRIYNYPEVLDNLDYALQEANNSEFKEAAEVRILTEQMFVQFDSRNFEEARKLMNTLEIKNTNLLNAEAHGFYLSAVAVLQMIDKKFDKAENTIKDALILMENDEPKHLPMIYTKAIGLAEHLGDKKMALEAFEKGMFYANKYKLDVYKISLYYTIAHFFVSIEDYKSAYLYENKGIEVSSRYNAAFQNGKLAVLEKKILGERKNLEIEFERKKTYFLALFSVLLVVLLAVVVILYRFKREKNKLIEKENDRIRMELQGFVIANKKDDKSYSDDFKFTSRQLEIINLVKQGKTNKEIGAELFISENTVKYHLKTVYTVLGIANRWDLK